MKFIDHLTLVLKAGDGGNGAISFLHLKNNPKAGPDGGDGGKGGNIIFHASKNYNTLFHLKNIKKITAANGENGSFKNQTGKNGNDTIINVPIGTVIIHKSANLNHKEEILLNLDKKTSVIFLKGGKGGKGNKKFATSKNKTPYIFEPGEKGQEIEVKLELKLLSDVSLVGLANVGKSTLLNQLSNAKAKVKNYPFTTLVPNLGVVNINHENTFVLADLPGLIKNASKNKGLGFYFLQHIERCKFIVFVLTLEANFLSLAKQLQILQTELKNYNPLLAQLPFLIVLSKDDLCVDKKQITDFKNQLPTKNIKIIPISSFTHHNLDYLKQEIFKEWKNHSNNSILENKIALQLENKINVFDHQQFLPSYFEILKIKKNIWRLKGDLITEIYELFLKNNNFLLFNMKLKKIGVFNQLKKHNIKEDDIIQIEDYEFKWKN